MNNTEIANHKSDLNDVILEATGALIVTENEEFARQYNARLRKIISSIQDLRDEIGSWKEGKA